MLCGPPDTKQQEEELASAASREEEAARSHELAKKAAADELQAPSVTFLAWKSDGETVAPPSTVGPKMITHTHVHCLGLHLPVLQAFFS